VAVLRSRIILCISGSVSGPGKIIDSSPAPIPNTAVLRIIWPDPHPEFFMPDPDPADPQPDPRLQNKSYIGHFKAKISSSKILYRARSDPDSDPR
jgi:hypothetical protein